MLVSNFFRKSWVVSAPLQTFSRAASNYGSLDSGLVNPSFIDVALSQLLKNKKAKKNDVNEFINHFKTRMNRQNFISLLHGCRRRRVLEPRHIYTAACGLKYADDEPLNGAQLQQVFTSLSFMSHRVASVRVLLTVTSEALSACDDKFTIDQLADFVFSLHQMKSGVPEVREMLRVLMTKLAACEEGVISSESASKLIGGFRGLSCKYPEVLEAQQAVLARLQSEGEEFNSEELSRALAGLQRLDLEQDGARRLVSVVLGRAGSGAHMNAHELSVGLLAAQCCGSDAEEAKELLRLLTVQTSQVTEGALPVRTVREVLAGLGGVTINEGEVSALTAALQAQTAE